MVFKKYENLLRCDIEKIFGFSPDTYCLQRFYDYGKLLIQWNDKINLTTIVDPLEIIIKHFIDSLYFAEPFLRYKTLRVDNILDIGTGAGFPGVPLKIVHDKFDITLMDAVQKKLHFLDDVILKLHLQKISTLHGRAEDIRKLNKYAYYDVVTARAVAPLSVLLEYALPSIRIGGVAVFGKGKNAEEEVKAAKEALKILSGEVIEIYEYSLGDIAEHRTLVVVRKNGETPEQYPRRAGTPSKKPL